MLQRTKEPLLLVQKLLQHLPKGSRLLSIEHVSSLLTGGLDQDETLRATGWQCKSDNVNVGRNANDVNAYLGAGHDATVWLPDVAPRLNSDKLLLLLQPTYLPEGVPDFYPLLR